MNLRLITPPATEPVSVSTAKAFLRVDHSSEDTLITSLIKSAREDGERFSRRAFITQTWDLILDEIECGKPLPIYRPPLQSVTSIKYVDSAGQEHAWTDFVVDTSSEPGTVIFNSLPGDDLRESGAWIIRFVAGYGNSESNVPERIKNVILGLVAHWYENRETLGVPDGIRDAFLAERVVWF